MRQQNQSTLFKLATKAHKNTTHPLEVIIPMLQRPRRNRRTENIRKMVSETSLLPSHLVLPLFITDGDVQAIPSLPGVCRHSIDSLVTKADQALQLGILAVALFPVINKSLKDDIASEATQTNGLLQQAIRVLKEKYPQLCIISDVAMDPYSIHGQDGLLANGQILNDETLEILAAMAINQASSGADYVAPSDMMDGRVKYIREALDNKGFKDTGIISYAAKYASSLYGPFRDALDSNPQEGTDKKTYQMDPTNSREALKEAQLDEDEGADILLVKPALPYLDIVTKIKSQTSLPVATYHVSGEYAMIKAASEKGWIDGEKVSMESHIAMKRAGADLIFTYSAIEIATSLQQ